MVPVLILMSGASVWPLGLHTPTHRKSPVSKPKQGVSIFGHNLNCFWQALPYSLDVSEASSVPEVGLLEREARW